MGRRGGGDKFHQQRKQELEKEAFVRQKENKNKIPDVIIACEDETSAPTYFRLMVEGLIRDKIITQDSFVVAKHRHTNPSGVLKDLTAHKCIGGKTYKNFEHKWKQESQSKPAAVKTVPSYKSTTTSVLSVETASRSARVRLFI